MAYPTSACSGLQNGDHSAVTGVPLQQMSTEKDLSLSLGNAGIIGNQAVEQQTVSL